MLKYKFYKYDIELAESVLTDFETERSVFVFPTEKSKKETIFAFQNNWNFSDTEFMTMEEFKEKLFISDLPVLKEDKRKIALYHSLSAEHRKELHCDSYFQFISFANNFFNLLTELNEERIAFDSDLTVLLKGMEFLPWQEKLHSTIVAIYHNYRLWLQQKGLSDPIFLYRESNYNDYFFGEYKRFVFVNQLYYTGLENFVLSKIDSEGKEVHVCYQIPESLINKKLNVLNKGVTAPYSKDWSYRTKKIKDFVVNNDFSMLIKLVGELSSEGSSDFFNIVDRISEDSGYSALLRPDVFTGKSTSSFTGTNIYLFFDNLRIILEAVTHERKKDRLLIPLLTIREIFANDIFSSYFLDSEEIKHHLLLSIDKLLQKDYRYLDPELTIPYQKDSHLASPPLSGLTQFLHKLMNVSNINDFITLIDCDEGIKIDRLISPQEKLYSNIDEVFYTTLANFSALNELKIIDDNTFWEGSGAFKASAIVNLFLLYLRPKRCQWSYQQTAKKSIEITSLLDTRNISYSKIALLNATEGILPTPGIAPFLFTENQRRVLGLKTYEDIRFREKYYFFRLILNTEEVTIFSQQNKEKNSDVSSFVEELKLNFPQLVVKDQERTENAEASYNIVYNKILLSALNYKVDFEGSKKMSFFTIPFDRDNDTIDSSFSLSNYTYSYLLDSPFAYYLKSVAKLDEEMTDEPLSHKLIGSICHYLVEKTFLNSVLPDRATMGGWERLKQSVSNYLNRDNIALLIFDNYYYQIPHTYSYSYFEQIVLPVIIKGIMMFFSNLETRLSGELTDYDFMPEQTAKEQQLFKVLSDKPGIVLKGRGDLIINNKQEMTTHIVDFKTGKIENRAYGEQLLIYELLYSRQDIYSSYEVKSFVYSLLEWTDKELMLYFPGKDKEQILSDFFANLEHTLTEINLAGFTPGKEKGQNRKFSTVLRSDLWHKYLIQESKKVAK